MIPIEHLQPGDVLLYRGKGFWSWGIRVKTWSHFSHCEIFDSYDPLQGNAVTLASRDGKGVNRYIFTDENLYAVLRPVTPPMLDMAAGRAWFEREAKGQPYDWVGLFAFFSARRQGSTKLAMFCSEFLSRFFKKCGYFLFRGDSDAISPGHCWTNPMLRSLWAHPDLPVRDLEW